MNVERLLTWQFEDIEQSYDAKDVILYSLGIGCGTDPTDPGQLQFVYEDGLVAFPTIALVLAYPGFWIAKPEFEVDWTGVLHGEQSITFHQPIPSSGRVCGKLNIEGVVDKGAKGAFVYSRRELIDAETGKLLATQRATTVCRNDGGLGGHVSAPPSVASSSSDWVRPDREADNTIRTPISTQAALLYRLSGDWNPLHADPKIARAAGFDAPILHGLCTFGIAARALVECVCGSDATRLRYIEARFSAPVYPGQTLITHMWRDGHGVQFEATTDGDSRPVLAFGRATVD